MHRDMFASMPLLCKFALTHIQVAETFGDKSIEASLGLRKSPRRVTIVGIAKFPYGLLHEEGTVMPVGELAGSGTSLYL